MMTLYDSIYSLRCKNHQSQCFVPRQSLFELLQQETIENALRETTPSQQLGELVQTILRGGRLIFSILIAINHVDYMIKFVERDQLQLSQLDDKLPYDLKTLETIMQEAHALQFYDIQWVYIAPTFMPFVLRRHLADDIILPFLSEEFISCGGFGDVYRIAIDPKHQKFDDSNFELVRKDLKPHPQDYENSERELETLSILKLLRHPNIIQLLGCYTYQRTHSFIFPRAAGKDLYSFLRSPLHSAFPNHSCFLLALAGLASAVAGVHNFAIKELNLTLIGCHHDLKTSNVLVDEDKFILADFGLARLKSPLENSSTPSRIRQGFSIAPECQALDGKFEKGRVHRSSDIWSFGCIMLEVVTYMLKGSKGIEEFESNREFRVGQIEYAYFHKGREHCSSAVTLWIQELHARATDPERLLLRLIEQMLQLDPKHRPNAEEVENSMIYIALSSLSQSAFQLFGTLCSMENIHEDSVKPWVEKIRFESWMRSLGLYDLSSEDKKVPHGPHLGFERFQRLSDSLKILIQELTTITSQEKDTNLRVLFRLRQLNTMLYAQIPKAEKAKAQHSSEVLLLKNDHLQELRSFDGDATGSNLDKVSTLSQSKLNSRLAQQNPSATASSPEITSRDIRKIRKLGSQLLCELTRDTGPTTNVIVDYKHYDDSYQGQQLRRRMESLTKLCQSVQNCEKEGLLNCRGFFHDKMESAFGLIYDFPAANEEGAGLKNGTPFTLFDSLDPLDSHKLRQVSKPSLGYRYQLAYHIAASISEVHKIGWVHKNLTSSNIIFFPQHESALNGETRPYLVGFRHGRPNEKTAFTEGPSSDADERYQHPQYLATNTRYFLHYDYYSLGIVLLEIGLWRKVQDVIHSPSLNANEARQKLQEKRVPMLGHYMGDAYQSVVEACLGDSFTSVQGNEEDQTDTECQLQFESRVLSQLSRLASLSI